MRKALIVWGGWSGHEPEQCAEHRRRACSRPTVQGRVENTTEAFADPALADLSLIVPIFTMWTIEKEEVENLTARGARRRRPRRLPRRHGRRVPRAVEYQFMVGGQWVAHPGNIIDYTVEITRPDDPIMAGLPPVSRTGPSSITCMSTPPTRCWPPRRFSGEHADGSTAW